MWKWLQSLWRQFFETLVSKGNDAAVDGNPNSGCISSQNADTFVNYGLGNVFSRFRARQQGCKSLEIFGKATRLVLQLIETNAVKRTSTKFGGGLKNHKLIVIKSVLTNTAKHNGTNNSTLRIDKRQGGFSTIWLQFLGPEPGVSLSQISTAGYQHVLAGTDGISRWRVVLQIGHETQLRKSNLRRSGGDKANPVATSL